MEPSSSRKAVSHPYMVLKGELEKDLHFSEAYGPHTVEQDSQVILSMNWTL